MLSTKTLVVSCPVMHLRFYKSHIIRRSSPWLCVSALVDGAETQHLYHYDPTVSSGRELPSTKAFPHLARNLHVIEPWADGGFVCRTVLPARSPVAPVPSRGPSQTGLEKSGS